MIDPNRIIGFSNISIFRDNGYDERVTECGQFRTMLTPDPDYPNDPDRAVLNIFRESDLSFLYAIKI
jgi:hypothetical protein